MADETNVVGAVGSASGAAKVRLSELVEAAMAKAVLDASEQGITDPDEVRAMMLAYRATVVKEHARRAAEEAARLARGEDSQGK